MRPVLTCLVPLAAACTAQFDTTSGPSFGGDQRAAHALQQLVAGDEVEGAVTEAGVLAAWPVAVNRFACREGPCLDTRSAWLPDDGLLVAIGMDAVVERDPVDLAFALDGSGSMSGFEDARAAAVEVALDRLTADDELAVWAFTSVAEELVASEPLTDAHRAEVRIALQALDGLPVVRELRGMQPEACSGTFDDLFVGAGPTDSADTGRPAVWADTGSWGGDLPEGAGALRDLVDTSSNERLGDQLLGLVCEDGSAIDEAAAMVLESLPDGTVERNRRMVLVTDLGGPSAQTAVEAAAERFVGTSVLGVSATSDTSAATALAAAPGAHTLDAPTLAHALATWEARFDAFMDPLAWDVHVDLADGSADDWVLERRVGTTDADRTGANAWFASMGNGVLGAVLRPVGEDPDPPVLTLTFATPDGDTTAYVPTRWPYRLIHTDWGEGDDEVALSVAWRLALTEALQAGDTSWAQELLEARRLEVRPTP